MTRAHMPGRAGVTTQVLHPDLHRITLTELDNEIPMHGDRPYPRSVPAPVVRPDPMRRRRLSKAAFTAVVALIGFGSLLLMFPRPVNSAALVVLVGQK